MLLQHGDSLRAHDCLHGVIARAHFSNDAILARLLINSYAVAKNPLAVPDVDGLAHVKLLQPAQLSCIICKHRHACTSTQISASQRVAHNGPSKTAHGKARAHLTFLSGVIQRWVPLSKFLKLTAILDDNFQIAATGTPAILNSLVQYWKPVFDGSQVQFSSEAAEQVFEATSNRSWDFSGYHVPSIAALTRTIKYSSDSSPGNDGLPYSSRKVVD